MATGTQDRVREAQDEIQSNRVGTVLKKIEHLTEGMLDLDWRKWPVSSLVFALTQIPNGKDKAGNAKYLSAPQALHLGTFCYTRKLDPFGNDVWYNDSKGSVNLSSEGKINQAREAGIVFGPPQFKRSTRPWPKGVNNPWKLEEDIGYNCTMTVEGFDKPAEFQGWLSEWAVWTSPVWKEKREHMLKTRIKEKAVSFGSGVGQSEMPGDGDILAEAEASEPVVELPKPKEPSSGKFSKEKK